MPIIKYGTNRFFFLKTKRTTRQMNNRKRTLTMIPIVRFISKRWRQSPVNRSRNG